MRRHTASSKPRPALAAAFFCSMVLGFAASSWLAGGTAVAAPPAQRQPKQTEPPSPVTLEAAEKLYSGLKYEEANRVAAGLLEGRGLPHDTLVRATRVLALSEAVLDREEAARLAFISLLLLEPDFQIDPNLGPRVAIPFLEARGFWRGQPQKPGIEASAAARAKGTAQVKVTLRDPTHVVKKIVVRYRFGAASEYSVRLASAPQSETISLGDVPDGAAPLDYFAEALDEREDVLMQAGDASTPKTTPVEPAPVVEATRSGGSAADEKSKSVFASPIFWTTVGVAVLGGGAAAFALTRPASAPTAAHVGFLATCGGAPCN